jgi:hypothetical protein
MIYSAQLRHVSDEVEGEVILTINGIDLTCFAYSSLPYDAKEGSLYQVELTAEVLNDYCVIELNEEASPSIIQIDNSFSYMITGRLNGNSLDAGCIVFEDDVLLSDFSYLEGKIISWKVDRIDAEFLSDD